MCLPIGISAAAFLAYNFSYLYFYYVTWNPGANSHLPWNQSVKHFGLAWSHVGTVLSWCALAAVLINLVCIRKRVPLPDWKPVWLALAAPLFLVVRGAGLTPFVSMPAVFGFLMFACLPFAGIQPAARYLWARAAIGILLAGGAIATATEPGQAQFYGGPSTTSMPGARALIDRANQDAHSKGFQKVEFIEPMLGECNACAISNILIFEYGAIPGDGKAMYVPGGLTFHFPDELIFSNASDELFWNLYVPGNSEKEKLGNIVPMMAAWTPTYLLLPDEPTLRWLERDLGFYYLNRQARELKSRLLALNKWESLGDPVQVGPHERIEVFGPRDPARK
jgi:hypothetical protein